MRTKFIDMIGRRFGKLVVVKKSSFKGNGKKPVVYWECLCDCGNTTTAPGGSIRYGTTLSCGCGIETTKFKVKHRLGNSHEYVCWQGMKQRCSGKEERYSKHYRDKGITVCPEWVNDFSQFYKDMGKAPSRKHTIDRKDNDKGYNKENCRWATTSEQNRNYSQNRVLTYNGQSMIVTDWAEKLGVSRHLIYGRLAQGWSVEDALTKQKVFSRVPKVAADGPTQ